jgi:presenilin-like A22 family membrane protease
MHTSRSPESCVLSEGVGIRLLYQQLNMSGKAVLLSILSSENGICGIWKVELGLFAVCIMLVTLAAYAAKSRFGLRVAEVLMLMSSTTTLALETQTRYTRGAGLRPTLRK